MGGREVGKPEWAGGHSPDLTAPLPCCARSRPVRGPKDHVSFLLMFLQVPWAHTRGPVLRSDSEGAHRPVLSRLLKAHARDSLASNLMETQPPAGTVSTLSGQGHLDPSHMLSGELMSREGG